jgi:hypothetical protein
MEKYLFYARFVHTYIYINNYLYDGIKQMKNNHLELMDYFSLIILSFLDPKISIKEMDFG